MTNYTEITGDLFELGLPAIGHGCNCAGVMGAGIARRFRHSYPGMYAAYAQRCAMHLFNLGDVFTWIPVGGPVVYNMATQPTPGPTADLMAIEKALRRSLRHAETCGLPRLGIPRIGAGLGGLEWADVAIVVNDLARHSPVDLVVVTLPEKEQAHA